MLACSASADRSAASIVTGIALYVHCINPPGEALGTYGIELLVSAPAMPSHAGTVALGPKRARFMQATIFAMLSLEAQPYRGEKILVAFCLLACCTDLAHLIHRSGQKATHSANDIHASLESLLHLDSLCISSSARNYMLRRDPRR